MKEVLYIQAGEISNYTGTHFWNTQESYLTDDGSDDTEPKVSFCESADKEKVTLCPRVLVIDRKSNFGALESPKSYKLAEEAYQMPLDIWNGTLVEYRQEPIRKSDYQIRMEDEESQYSETEISKDSSHNQEAGEIRYWSDFSRVYYLPRSLQRVPDPPDWASNNFNWVEGQNFFSQVDENLELMDGSLRLFVEDCDNMQGVQLLNDTDTFGSFLSSFFASFRDEYPKVPSLAFPIISNGISKISSIDNDEDTRKILNEALYLRTLNEFSTMNIPVTQPETWPSAAWGRLSRWPRRSRYHQSAILSTHIETATLPFRAKHIHGDIASTCALLKRRGTSSYGEMSGMFPVSSIMNLEEQVTNFSSDVPKKSPTVYTRIDVTRGFSSNQIGDYNEWCSRHRSPMGPYITSIHSFGYPLPTSFPPFSSGAIAPRQGHRSGAFSSHDHLPTTEVFSSLATSSNTAHFIKQFALFVEKCVNRRPSSVLAIGLSFDDIKELSNDIWTMHDNCSEDGQALDL